MTEISEFLQNCHYFPSLQTGTFRKLRTNTDFAS